MQPVVEALAQGNWGRNLNQVNQLMEKTPRKSCRTFNREDSAPVSIATVIERHEAMLTPAMLAVLLAISVKSIYAWVKAGTLPACILGTSIRFDPCDTAAWIRARTE
jgi:excisionase family DNA binding protein